MLRERARKEQSSEEKLEIEIARIKGIWKEVPDYQINQEKMRHLAVICDGNRRAAESVGLPPQFGHTMGLETIRGLMKASRDWQINTLTIWAWSTENWQRTEKQVDYVMDLAVQNLAKREIAQELVGNRVNFTHIGRKDRLPPNVIDSLAQLEKLTQTFSRHHLNLALDYGGLDEISHVTLQALEAVEKGEVKPEDIKNNPELLMSYSYFGNQLQPDLIIRSGMKEGEMPRTSGFMQLQSGYSCWSFLNIDFPDLEPQHIIDAIVQFEGYERRLGQ